jgi:hypothetical protein
MLMSRFSAFTGLVLGTLVAGWALPASAVIKSAGIKSAGIKCWLNHEGVKECGNTVPAEYAQQGHEEKNKFGLTVKTQERAKTAEEVVAENAARKAKAAEDAVAAAKAKAQGEIDGVLLATFSSEDDLQMARDGQIENVESQIKITESHIAKLDKSLDQMIAKAAGLEKQGKPVNNDLTRGIENTRRQIEEQRQFILTKREEQGTIRKKFDGDLARFKELRSANK